MRKTRWVTGTGAVLAACLAAVTACDRGAEVRAAPSDAAAAVPAPPRKVVERFQARLVASSGEDAPFSAVTGLDVDSEGRIYVADWLLPDVVVLGPDGRHVRSIGRRGSGPGEFQRVSSVQVLPGDSVLVFDRGLRRVTVFPPSGGEAAYTIGLHAKRLPMLPMAVMRVPGSELLVAWYSAPYTAQAFGPDGSRPLDVLRVLTAQGEVERDSLLLFPSAEQLVVRSRGRLSVGPHPFGREAYVRVLAGDRLVYAWNDSIGFKIVGLDGRLIARLGEPHGWLEVTAEELRQLETEVPPHAVEVLRAAEPKTWPALQGMVVDDLNRVWLGVRTRGEQTEWAAYTLDGHYIGSALLPRELALHAIRWPRAYGVIVDELDVPTIVIYELSETPQPLPEP